MTIQDELIKKIKLNGPIPVDDFMGMVIPYYYQHQKPFGSAGDFITAPEISQMFGEIIGIWVASHWLNAINGKFTLVEVGGGNGTLMSDLLRGTKHIKGFHDSIAEIAMIEASETLKQKQSEKVKFPSVNWYKDLSEVKADTSIVICNEFFDALPIKQYKKVGREFKEIHVGYKNENFEFVESPVGVNLSKECPDGGVLEFSPASIEYAAKIKNVIGAKGAALIIDYGYVEPDYHSTLQSLRKHKFCSVLENIGEADITALVDFSELANVFIGRNALVLEQGDFLVKYGIVSRAAALIANGAGSGEIHSSLNRLINPDQMGRLFKVLEIV